jgi:RNA polymerase sigma-32 factor
MMGRKQAATSAPPISALDLDGYEANPGDPADRQPATDPTATRRRPSAVGLREAAEVLPGRAKVGPAGRSSLSAYLRELRHHPLLSREEEHALAVRYGATGDRATAQRLVTANLRLVVKIAQDYRRVHRNLIDLIQEGNLGLMQAVEKYDPYRGVKLSSYAAWWIRAYILKYILANWRMVKLGTTQPQRKLFFNLRRERERLNRQGFEVDAEQLATALDVSAKEVVDMERRLSASETSLDAPAPGDGRRTQADLVADGPGAQPDRQVEEGEFQEVLRRKLDRFGARLTRRESDLFRKRLLSERPETLERIGATHGISRERARQIEERLKVKLRRYLEAELGEAVRATTDEAAARDRRR